MHASLAEPVALPGALRVSVGVALDAQALLARADAAMYEAKRATRTAVVELSNYH